MGLVWCLAECWVCGPKGTGNKPEQWLVHMLQEGDVTDTDRNTLNVTYAVVLSSLHVCWRKIERQIFQMKKMEIMCTASKTMFLYASNTWHAGKVGYFRPTLNKQLSHNKYVHLHVCCWIRPGGGDCKSTLRCNAMPDAPLHLPSFRF